MVKWEKVKVLDEDGEFRDAIAPQIISASRSTDLPAFYSDWFVERIKKGYLVWVNPFNRRPSYISFENLCAIVFWSKNPGPMLKHLNFFNERNIDYYFQFTLNNYEKEKYEPNIPELTKRISLFKNLSKLTGKGRVIWRYDPVIISDNLTVDEHIERIQNIGNEIYTYTDKLVISFIDINPYKKVQKNLDYYNERELQTNEMKDFAKKLSDLNCSNGWDLEIATCGEEIDLKDYGIVHNQCIDGDLMKRIFLENSGLMDFLRKNNVKDKGQRKVCGCIASKDIGQYNTCGNFCVYCYANKSKAVAEKNMALHNENPFSETITGDNSWKEHKKDNSGQKTLF